jgi:hypothetical protein
MDTVQETDTSRENFFKATNEKARARESVCASGVKNSKPCYLKRLNFEKHIPIL